jgi:hypothetical protein
MSRELQFAEVQFYFGTMINDSEEAFALVSVFSAPDCDLLECSTGTLWSCKHQGDEGLSVIPASSIISVVAMVPFSEGSFIVVEKLGLEVACMGGIREEMADE